MTTQVNKAFTIMGSSFVPGASALIDRLKPNQRLELLREPTNPKHANAIKIMWSTKCLGWLPRKQSPRRGSSRTGCSST